MNSMIPRLFAIAVVAGTLGSLPAAAGASQALSEQTTVPLDGLTFTDAQNLFFNGRYRAAAVLTLALRSSDPQDLASYELRTSALLFELKHALGEQGDKEKAFERCLTCADLMAAFLSDTARGQALARARLQATPGDEAALFFLGKIDLNYVWLQLGPLGRRKGWDEYWEARKSLDAVLKQNPRNVRAAVARAWIDYIVDTKMPRGTRWVLGGGSKQRALATMREAASTETEFFIHAEAAFALWEMQLRERNTLEATEVARRLALTFPENRQLARFLEAHDPT
jgi:tetratricopeptide (TPR) repeat protein